MIYLKVRSASQEQRPNRNRNCAEEIRDLCLSLSNGFNSPLFLWLNYDKCYIFFRVNARVISHRGESERENYLWCLKFFFDFFRLFFEIFRFCVRLYIYDCRTVFNFQIMCSRTVLQSEIHHRKSSILHGKSNIHHGKCNIHQMKHKTWCRVWIIYTKTLSFYWRMCT